MNPNGNVNESMYCTNGAQGHQSIDRVTLRSKMIKIRGDGNCFFNALVLIINAIRSLNGGILLNNPYALRKMLINVNHNVFFKLTGQDSIEYNKWKIEVKKDRNFCFDFPPAARMLANKLRIKICIWTWKKTEQRFYCEVYEGHQVWATVNLLQVGIHYDLLISKSQYGLLGKTTTEKYVYENGLIFDRITKVEGDNGFAKKIQKEINNYSGIYSRYHSKLKKMSKHSFDTKTNHSYPNAIIPHNNKYCYGSISHSEPIMRLALKLSRESHKAEQEKEKKAEQEKEKKAEQEKEKKAEQEKSDEEYARKLQKKFDNKL